MPHTKRKGEEPIIQNPRVEKVFEPDNEITVPWRIFRIMSEFVSGFDFLRKYSRPITIFGSARSTKDTVNYQEAEKLTSLLARDGYTIITGGGPGIMEAANKGAKEAGGVSAGISIQLENEEHVNEYVSEAETFKYFFTRKTMLAYASRVYVFFPGGYGTLDELFELLTLVQTKKIDRIPIILINRSYWEPLLSWIETVVCKQNQAISEEDMDLYHLVEDAEEAHSLITRLVEETGIFEGH